MATSAAAARAGGAPTRSPLPSTTADKIAEGQRLRDEALALLKDDQPRQAAVKFKTCFAYTKGLFAKSSDLGHYAALIGQQTVMDEDQEAAVQSLELACNEGLATIYLRSGDYERALGYSEQVLVSDPENVKGLFRAGQLHLRLKNIEAAKVPGRGTATAARKKRQGTPAGAPPEFRPRSPRRRSKPSTIHTENTSEQKTNATRAAGSDGERK